MGYNYSPQNRLLPNIFFCSSRPRSAARIDMSSEISSIFFRFGLPIGFQGANRIAHPFFHPPVNAAACRGSGRFERRVNVLKWGLEFESCGLFDTCSPGHGSLCKNEALSARSRQKALSGDSREAIINHGVGPMLHSQRASN